MGRQKHLSTDPVLSTCFESRQTLKIAIYFDMGLFTLYIPL